MAHFYFYTDSEKNKTIKQTKLFFNYVEDCDKQQAKPVEWPEWSHNNMIKCTESKEFIKKLEEGAQCLPTGWRFSIVR